LLSALACLRVLLAEYGYCEYRAYHSDDHQHCQGLLKLEKVQSIHPIDYHNVEFKLLFNLLL